MRYENPIARRVYKKELRSISSPYYTVTLKLYLRNGFKLTIKFESSLAELPFKLEVAKINTDKSIKVNGRWPLRYATLVIYHNKTYDFIKDKIWEYINYNRKKKYKHNDDAIHYLFREWSNPGSPHNPWKWLKMT